MMIREGLHLLVVLAFVSVFSSSGIVGAQVPDGLDHVVVGTPSLSATVDYLEGILGVRAIPGGKHPVGTENAIIPLIGDKRYIEVLGLSSDWNPQSQVPIPFGIDKLKHPKVVAWAVKSNDLMTSVGNAYLHRIAFTPPFQGSRVNSDGSTLTWMLAAPLNDLGGVLPFYIDWGTSPHPSTMANPMIELIDIRAVSKNADVAERDLAALGVPNFSVISGDKTGLIITIKNTDGAEVALEELP